MGWFFSAALESGCAAQPPATAVTVGMVATGLGLHGRFRSLYWRLREQMRRQVGCVGRHRRQQRPRFYYDPSSYALNFDDGASGFLC